MKHKTGVQAKGTCRTTRARFPATAILGITKISSGLNSPLRHPFRNFVSHLSFLCFLRQFGKTLAARERVDVQ